MSGFIQQVLQDIAPFFDANITASHNVSSPITPSSVPSIPSDLTSLLTLLFSFGALRDWLKLIVIGGVLETCRRTILNVYESILDSFYIRASFDQEDDCYQWMLVWLSKQPSWSKARNFEIATRFGTRGAGIELDMLADDGDDDSSRKVSCLPSVSVDYSLWYRWNYITISKTLQEPTLSYGGRQSTLHMSILTRNQSVIVDILQDARREYMGAQEKATTIWISDAQNNWLRGSERSKRSLDSVILEPGVKDLLLDDARDFLHSKEWYHERGIPFRRGYLLYGVPGAGKTSIIHSLAGELKLDIYVISLSRIGLDDAGLDALINDLPERCIALMEDIDAAFSGNLNREDDSDDNDQQKKMKAAAPTTSKVSLSGLLNALDGVGAQEGRILFATTNKYGALDPALTRPGRMDLHVEFKLSSKFQAQELFKRFYMPRGVPAASLEKEEEKEEKEVEEEEDDEEEEAPSPLDSGFASLASASDLEEKNVRGTLHGTPEISTERLERLAKEFAEIVPDREFSMASLQGYLMTKKMWPVAAVKGAREWVEKELEGRERKKN